VFPAEIRVLLVDDHQMLREGLRAVLARETGIKIVAEADNGRDAMQKLREQPVDLVVMDIGMAELNGVEATRRILARYPELKIVALSGHADPRYVRSMLEAGAHGYVVKSAAGDELLRAIRAALKNQKFISAEIASGVIDGYLQGKAATVENAMPTRALGAREREVLQLLAEGRTSASIAQTLNLSLSTVEVHRRNIMKKLDLHSVAELTKYAIREGLTSLGE
jgi:two-component system NarL family response regulator